MCRGSWVKLSVISNSQSMTEHDFKASGSTVNSVIMISIDHVFTIELARNIIPVLQAFFMFVL